MHFTRSTIIALITAILGILVGLVTMVGMLTTVYDSNKDANDSLYLSSVMVEEVSVTEPPIFDSIYYCGAIKIAGQSTVTSFSIRQDSCSFEAMDNGWFRRQHDYCLNNPESCDENGLHSLQGWGFLFAEAFCCGLGMIIASAVVLVGIFLMSKVMIYVATGLYGVLFILLIVFFAVVWNSIKKVNVECLDRLCKDIREHGQKSSNDFFIYELTLAFLTAAVEILCIILIYSLSGKNKNPSDKYNTDKEKTEGIDSHGIPSGCETPATQRDDPLDNKGKATGDFGYRSETMNKLCIARMNSPTCNENLNAENSRASNIFSPQSRIIQDDDMSTERGIANPSKSSPGQTRGNPNDNGGMPESAVRRQREQISPRGNGMYQGASGSSKSLLVHRSSADKNSPESVYEDAKSENDNAKIFAQNILRLNRYIERNDDSKNYYDRSYNKATDNQTKPLVTKKFIKSASGLMEIEGLPQLSQTDTELVVKKIRKNNTDGLNRADFEKILRSVIMKSREKNICKYAIIKANYYEATVPPEVLRANAPTNGSLFHYMNLSDHINNPEEFNKIVLEIRRQLYPSYKETDLLAVGQAIDVIRVISQRYSVPPLDGNEITDFMMDFGKRNTTYDIKDLEFACIISVSISSELLKRIGN